MACVKLLLSLLLHMLKCILLLFGVRLLLHFFFLNRIYGRKVYIVLDPPHLPEIWHSADLVTNKFLALLLNWKALILLAAGFLGGIFTSISGSGIDICSFSVLTLLFRISEKTATPTSVVLMAINTVIATIYTKFHPDEGFHELVWEFFVVCAPIVVIGAPLGSIIGSIVHRLVLASFIYVTDAVQLAGALYVVRPWTTEKCHNRPDKPGRPSPDCRPLHLCWTSALIFVSGLVAFYIFQAAGEKLIIRNNRIEQQSEANKTDQPAWSIDGSTDVERPHSPPAGGTVSINDNSNQQSKYDLVDEEE
uniref:Membrane transporter protein n=1 Tax=Aureoumbra lagunensis TaxID=44058 RepID=A0A7S3JS29_9STRA